MSKPKQAKAPPPPTEDKAAQGRADAYARRRSARGYRSTIMSDMVRTLSPTLG